MSYVLSDEAYEARPNLLYRKGTCVLVTARWEDGIGGLERFVRDYADSPDAEWREATQAALNEMAAIEAAVGRVFTVEEYTIGANPHGITVDGLLIFLPAECLQPA